MTAPKLRFKEFNGDWSNSELGQIIGISSASRVFKEQWQDSGVPFFRTSDVSALFKNKENEKAYISVELFEELSKKSGRIQKDDLLVTGGGTIGIPYLVPNNDPLYFKDADLLWFKSSGVIEGSFLYNFLISSKFREYLKSISHTGTISHFTIEQAKTTPFKFPIKEEQTKIASFLSAVDEKISQLTQKHELLNQYKQGMMQKLFSQQIRFKADDGSEFREWEEKKLSEISQKAMYGMNAAATEYDGINKYLRITDICEFSNKFKMSNLTSPNAELEDKYKLQLGDLLFARTGASVGKSYLYNEDDGITYFAGFLIKFSLNINLVIPYFIFLQTLTKEFSQWVVTNSMRSGQPGINAEEYSSYILKVPCLEEQTKIANFLSAIDQKIEVVAQQIEQAKVWKKGLLQQMFV